MKTVFVIFYLLFAVTIFGQQKPIKLPNDKPLKPPKEKTKKIKIRKMSVEERLKGYFYGREIRPAIIINNLDSIRDEGEETIDVSNHKIVWFHSFKETRIKIDGDVFSLKDKKTLNNVDGEKRNVDFADDWDQIKLFKFGDRELIGISMFNKPCTGTGCSIMMFLIYDLQTKNKSFFGTYRFLLNKEFGLFDFANDGSLDFLSGTYVGESDGVAVEIQNIYEIYTMDDAGTFHLQSDKKGNSYFMKRVYKEDNYEEVDGKFRQNWIEEIK